MAKIVELVAVTDIGVGSGDFWVKVIDYDGTVLLEKRGNNGDSFDLPSAPSHEGLVFQEWSASQAITDNKIIIANNNVMVGAVYTTASGQNEFDITLTKATGLAVTLNMDGTKDWGDGTSDTNTTHTYTAYGNYTIKCNGTTMTTSSSSGLFGQSNSAPNYYCTAARLATAIQTISYAFEYCYSLANVIISREMTGIGENDSFYRCLSLTCVVIPQGIASIGITSFQFCFSLAEIVIPQSVTHINTDAFYSCYSLTNIIIPKGIKKIGNMSFYSCYSLVKYDFSQCTAVPTNEGSPFRNINAICKIIVPDSLYDEWIAATNWSTYADYIYKASEVTA